MEQKEKNKIGFFKRMKLAIFKLEDYGMFLGERLTVAFKYFFLLLLLVSVIVTIVTTYDFSKIMNKAYDYIENEMPDFEYENGIAKSTETVEAYDEEYGFRFFVNTSDELTDNNIKEYKNKIYDGSYGIIVLKDKLICISSSYEMEESYTNLETQYNFDIHNKQDLNNKLNELGKTPLFITYFIFELIVLYITNVISILGDVCLVAIFGWIAARICGIRFKMTPMISLAIYSLSLSIVLSGIYNCVFVLTGFVIQYFNIIYLLIAYVYIIAAIFMIKYDLIKQTAEIEKIIEVQKQVKQELDSQKEDKKQEEEEKDKDKDKEKNKDKKDSNDEDDVFGENNEPDGSEI